MCTGDHATLVSCTRLSTCFSIWCVREIILPWSPVQGCPLVSLSRVYGRSSTLVSCTRLSTCFSISCVREIILPWSPVQSCPLVSLSRVYGRSSYLDLLYKAVHLFLYLVYGRSSYHGLLYRAVHLFLYLVCTGDHLTLVLCKRLSTCFSISCEREIILPWSPVQGCPLVSLSHVYGRSSYLVLLTRLSTCFSILCVREIILPWSPVQGYPLVSLSQVYGRSSYLVLLYKAVHLFLYLVCLYLVCTGDHLTLVSCTRISTCIFISCVREIILPWSPVQGYPLVSLSRMYGRSSYLGLLYKAVHLFLYLVCTGDHLTLISTCLLYKAVHLYLYLVCTGDHLTLVSCTRLSTCFSTSCEREIILPWSPVQGCPLVSLSRVYGRSSYLGLLYKAVHLFLYLVCMGDHLTLVSCTRLSTCFSISCVREIILPWSPVQGCPLVSLTRVSISCVREIILPWSLVQGCPLVSLSRVYGRSSSVKTPEDTAATETLYNNLNIYTHVYV